MVSAQQKLFLGDQNKDRWPRLAFMEDLLKEAKSWQEQGDQLTIMMNANKNIMSGDVRKDLNEITL